MYISCKSEHHDDIIILAVLDRINDKNRKSRVTHVQSQTSKDKVSLWLHNSGPALLTPVQNNISLKMLISAVHVYKGCNYNT